MIIAGREGTDADQDRYVDHEEQWMIEEKWPSECFQLTEGEAAEAQSSGKVKHSPEQSRRLQASSR